MPQPELLTPFACSRDFDSAINDAVLATPMADDLVGQPLGQILDGVVNIPRVEDHLFQICDSSWINRFRNSHNAPCPPKAFLMCSTLPFETKRRS